MTQENTKRPGETALENMKILKNESSLFKVPKVPPIKRKVTKTHILDEEDYVQVNINSA